MSMKLHTDQLDHTCMNVPIYCTYITKPNMYRIMYNYVDMHVTLL